MFLTSISLFGKIHFKFLLSIALKRKIVSKLSDRKNCLKTLYILVLMIVYDAALLLIHLMIKPIFLLFDDNFVSENGLFHYVDFRPGYPPLGKLPYTLFYMLFKNNPVPLVVYNIVILDFALYILFKILSEITSLRRAKILTAIVALNPVFVWATICNSHADMLVATFLLLGIRAFIKEKVSHIGAYCGLGFMTKIYPAILLVPLFFRYNLKERLTLLSMFMVSVVFISLPFLILDPLMYASTFIHHLLRGPSESVFALLDGYYYHTGFLHPTYEATIYTWQFASIYQPSHYDHFRYEWQHPSLRFFYSLLQLGFFSLFSLMAGKSRSKIKAVESTSLAALLYFAFSAFWNPLIAIPVLLLVVFITLGRKLVHQLLIVSPLFIVDFLHMLTWFPGLVFGVGMSLLMIVSLRTIIFSILFLTCSPTVRT